MFATSNINSGDVIFTEKPLVSPFNLNKMNRSPISSINITNVLGVISILVEQNLQVLVL